eukprot:7560968-Lingulodinium_polyedra.AAC.1
MAIEQQSNCYLSQPAILPPSSRHQNSQQTPGKQCTTANERQSGSSRQQPRGRQAAVQQQSHRIQAAIKRASAIHQT